MISCPSCRTPAPPEAIGTEAACQGCAAPLQVIAFPRLLQGVPPGKPAEPVTTGDQACCYYHAGNLAEIPCDGCGRYLCSVCDLVVDGHHLCPSCLEDGRHLASSQRFVSERVLWGNIVLSLAVLPLIVFYLTVLTAPVALALGIRHLKTPGSLVRSRTQLYFGLAIAGCEIIGWLVLFGYLLVRILRA